MGVVEAYLPSMAMIGTQISYAVMTLTARAAFLEGLSPRVFVVYRQAIATLVLAPVAYFSKSNSRRISMDLRSFSLIFLIALVGITIDQNTYLEGVYLAGSSTATAMVNLIPAVTFLMAAVSGMESVHRRSWRTIAKIGGTVMCVSGAMCMAFLRGPKLLNARGFAAKSAIFGVETDTDAWLWGCLNLLVCCCTWSLWLILQVPALAIYPDNLSLSAWMCIFSTVQSVIVVLLVEPYTLEGWKIHSNMGVFCCFFSGIVCSGIVYYVQAWCILKRGPVFSAMFNPLCTVIVTILEALFLHEHIYIGSLLGSVTIIVGLYIVLWGKSEDYVKKEETHNPGVVKEDEDCETSSAETSNHNKVDLDEPFLSEPCLRSTSW